MDSAEVSRKVFDGRSVRAMLFLVEAGKLVSLIGDVSLHVLLEEVEISKDRAVVVIMVERRQLKIFSDNHAGIVWR